MTRPSGRASAESGARRPRRAVSPGSSARVSAARDSGAHDGAEGRKSPPLTLHFEDNSLLPLLFGEHDRNLARIERDLGVAISARGNRVAISGPGEALATARFVLEDLYERIAAGAMPDAGEVDALVRLAATGSLPAADQGPGFGAGRDPARVSGRGRAAGKGSRRQIKPRTPTQGTYLQAMHDHELVLGLGPAGTGKTYLAVATAVGMLQAGEVDRIILSRPAVEAGERLGFLPGDLRDKVDPYLRPLYDALYDMMPADQVLRRLANGEIEVAPLAFMRGRTLAHAFIILDEAQNTTGVQMKMCLTRMGEGSRMVVTGDLSQIDLPAGTRSGLADAVEALADVEGVAMIRFTDRDMVRHPLVNRVVRAYERVERRRRPAAAKAEPEPKGPASGTAGKRPR